MIRLVEHGYRPSDDMLGRIAKALKVGPSDLLLTNDTTPQANEVVSKSWPLESAGYETG